jgi:hypothetical protein
MAEYIERDKLSADFELCNKQNPRWTPQRVASLIARENAADVVPVVHGRWEEWAVQWRECSACRYRIQYSYAKDCNFCPHCGAHMKDGE